MDDSQRFESLRRLERLLDRAFRVPGTNVRFGWDPIIGLVPWIGDLVTALFSCAIVVHAHRMRIPRIVQFRMILNIAIDLLVGIVPVLGDAVDVFWKSNTKNMRLLERHAVEVRPPTGGDWLFVVGIAVAVIAMAILPLIVLYWVVRSRPLI